MSGFARHWGEAGPEALLLHCSLSHSGAWTAFARALKGRLRMTAPDLVGHGKAEDHDPARNLHDQSTEAAAAFLPEDPCHLVGHSFGATVTLRLAIENPGRVATLTLCEPVLFAAAGQSPGRAATDARLTEKPALVQAGRLAEAARLFLDVWGALPFDRMPAEQQAYMADRMPLIEAQDPALNGDSAGLLPRLGQLEMPVLLVEGADSPPVVAEINGALARDLPDARRLVVPRAGHMVPLTHPGPVARAVAELIGV